MKLTIQDINITLLASNFTSTVLKPKTLRREDLLGNRQKKRLMLEDGVSTVLQFDRVVFSEPIGINKKLKNIKTPSKALAFVKATPKLNYQQLSIDFNSYLNFDSQQNLEQFLSESILGCDPWQKSSLEKVIALKVELVRPYKEGMMSLNIDKTNIKNQNQLHSIIWFVGKFQYQPANFEDVKPTKFIQEKIRDYKSQALEFQKFASSNFPCLKKTKTS